MVKLRKNNFMLYVVLPVPMECFFKEEFVLCLSRDEYQDFQSIPLFKQAEQACLDFKFFDTRRREYLRTTYLIRQGGLPLETEMDQLSDIQVLLLMRGHGFPEDQRMQWYIKLQPRLPSIDIMLMLKYT